MKRIIILRILFISMSATFTTNFPAAQTTPKKPFPKTASKKIQPISTTIKLSIRDSLVNLYYQKYQAERQNYGGYAVKVDTTSYGAISVNYVGVSNNYLGPETIIPALDNFIEGDLNNDGYNDLLVSVYHTQGSRPRLDIYCYITTHKQLQFYTMYTGRGLGVCKNISDTSGRFFPAKIVNGQLIGGTDCYSKNDPGCCPSLEMTTTFLFDNGFKFVKQVPKKK